MPPFCFHQTAEKHHFPVGPQQESTETCIPKKNFLKCPHSFQALQIGPMALYPKGHFPLLKPVCVRDPSWCHARARYLSPSNVSDILCTPFLHLLHDTAHVCPSFSLAPGQVAQKYLESYSHSETS